MAESEEQKKSSSSESVNIGPGPIEISRGSDTDLSPPRGRQFPIVGIGGSAGGLDAFSKLLQGLLTWNPLNLRPIGARMLKLRIAQAMLQLAMIG